MFNSTELEAIAASCKTELWFLRKVESEGVSTIQQQTLVGAIRMKATQLAEQARKVEAAAEQDKK